MLTDRHTDRQAHHNTPLPYQCGVNIPSIPSTTNTIPTLFHPVQKLTTTIDQPEPGCKVVEIFATQNTKNWYSGRKLQTNLNSNPNW